MDAVFERLFVPEGEDINSRLRRPFRSYLFIRYTVAFQHLADLVYVRAEIGGKDHRAAHLEARYDLGETGLLSEQDWSFMSFPSVALCGVPSAAAFCL